MEKIGNHLSDGQTVVSLKDGGSNLLGGLVASRGGATQRGLPVLGKLPVVGKLFRTDGDTEDRTELMILVIPYLVRSPEEAAELAKTLAPIE